MSLKIIVKTLIVNYISYRSFDLIILLTIGKFRFLIIVFIIFDWK